jgi:hypothetical protein
MVEDDEIEIQNVVASATFNQRLPLDRIAIYLKNTEYEPEQFPGLGTLKIRRPQHCCSDQEKLSVQEQSLQNRRRKQLTRSSTSYVKRTSRSM